MHLDLTQTDAAELHDLLQTYLPEIRREVAATESAEYRRQLERRQALCERLLRQLPDPNAPLEVAHHQL